MSHTVYEEDYLGNFPCAESYAPGQVPLPLPDRAASHQGLYLDADDDQLIGRAQNGELPISMQLFMCTMGLGAAPKFTLAGRDWVQLQLS